MKRAMKRADGSAHDRPRVPLRRFLARQACQFHATKRSAPRVAAWKINTAPLWGNANQLFLFYSSGESARWSSGAAAFTRPRVLLLRARDDGRFLWKTCWFLCIYDVILIVLVSYWEHNEQFLPVLCTLNLVSRWNRFAKHKLGMYCRTMAVFFKYIAYKNIENTSVCYIERTVLLKYLKM